MSGTAEVVVAVMGANMARQARWLVVVRRDQPGLYHYLRQEFEGIGLVDVILDRRQGDAPWAGEARAERRRPATLKEGTRWRSFGYQVVPRTGGYGAGRTERNTVTVG